MLLTAASAQNWYNHPELTWQTFETEHFIIHYHDETERSAMEASVIAEHIYPSITQLYNYEPYSKTHVIIMDTDDYSNGGAYYYDNKILIWAMPLDFELRGSHRWLQNVITHEFTHIVQLGAAMKYPRKIPAGYFQYIGYEDEKRDDVLYGYPNIIASYPIPGTVMPMWMAEGTAQTMYPGADFDFWDSHRDMILRDAVLTGTELSFSEMNSFGKRGIGNEQVYNQGFAFVNYLTDRFGPEVRLRITEEMRKPFQYSIRKAIGKATGTDGQELYEEWIVEMSDTYRQRLESVRTHSGQGVILTAEGTTNVHPVWSPDESRFGFLSNRDHDYFGQTDLFMYDFADSSITKIMAWVQSPPCWLNDSTLVYSKRIKRNKNGSRYFDLYRLNLNTEEEERITTDARLIAPTYNPESGLLAAITTFDGTSNIVVTHRDSIDFQLLTFLDDGSQFFTLTWDGDDLLTDITRHHHRDLIRVKPDGTIIEEMTGSWDIRDADVSDSGRVFSSDRSGIPNLRLETRLTSGYVTNVAGGAFMPALAADGRILYSHFENGQYAIAVLNDPAVIPSESVGYAPDFASSWPVSELLVGSPEVSSRPYVDTIDLPFFVPRIMVEYETVKPGFYFFGNDILDHQFFFGGASINSLGDKDLFLLYEYNRLRPSLYANLFWVSRNIEENTLYQDYYPVKSDLTIQFFGAELGMRFPIGINKFWLQYSYSKYRENINQIYGNIPGTGTARGGIAFDYFHGHELSLRWNLNARKPEFGSNMLPSNGYEIDARLGHEWNNFMDGFGLNEEYSSLQPDFVPNDTWRLAMDLAKHYTINHKRKIVASLESKIETISKPDIDDFFHFFGGGLPGIKGYTFYDSTLAGTSLFINTASVRVPVFKEKSYDAGHLNIQNMSCGIIGQWGGGFTGRLPEWIDEQKYKMSAGVELRVNGFSFYGYPTALAWEYHVPLNDDNESDGKQYVTLLFNF